MHDDDLYKLEEIFSQNQSPDNKQKNSLQELITVKQAAEICGMSAQMFSSLHKAGKTPHVLKFGRLRRWRKEEIYAWIKAGCPEWDD